MKLRHILLSAALLCAGAAQAQPVVKIGMVAMFSGPFAAYGQQFQRGAELYLDEVGGKAGGARIELVTRDEAGGPEKVKQVTQELIVRDKVQMLMGYVLTPDAAAVAPLVTQSKTPTLILNAATASLTRKSPYFVRMSFTEWQNGSVIANWAAKNGVKNAYLAVADYAPGHDSRDAFKHFFTKAGGTIAGEALIPMGTSDYAPFVQKIKDAKPDAIYVFMPVGPPSVGVIKTYYQLGLPEAGIKLIATGAVDELDLPAIGEKAVGVVTAYQYTPYTDNPTNKRFVAAYKKKYGADQTPNFAAAAAYDAMQAAVAAINKLNGVVDGDKAMEVLKNWKGQSPRGPIAIDPKERDIVQPIAIRRVQKVGNALGNVPFESVPDVKDPWKELNP
ncbi:MAG TPA: ABC transporter substrate-binding protein [Ramlibacter sp.]|nr:ABC transporter substrate-binding protein [Ramlibacter sp.]